MVAIWIKTHDSCNLSMRFTSFVPSPIIAFITNLLCVCFHFKYQVWYLYIIHNSHTLSSVTLVLVQFIDRTIIVSRLVIITSSLSQYSMLAPLRFNYHCCWCGFTTDTSYLCWCNPHQVSIHQELSWGLSPFNQLRKFHCPLSLQTHCHTYYLVWLRSIFINFALLQSHQIFSIWFANQDSNFTLFSLNYFIITFHLWHACIVLLHNIRYFSTCEIVHN